MKRSSISIITGLILVAIMLSSCFIPDNYETTITVHKDGSYDFEYIGELNFGPALAAVIEGTYDENDEADLQGVINDMKDEPGFESVKDLGKGKIKVGVEINMDPEKDYYFLSEDLAYFKVVHLDNGNLEISGMGLTEDYIESLGSIDTKMLGTMTVNVAKGLKVKSHNADKKKKIDKKLSAYTWELNMNSEKPEIVIKP